MPTKFTQEIKDNWLAALKSGKYKQGFTQLHHTSDNSFCCLGVLGDATKGLCNNLEKDNDPYIFLEKTIGNVLTTRLYETNDKDYNKPDYPRDYSNVIPLIEQLPVQE